MDQKTRIQTQMTPTPGNLFEPDVSWVLEADWLRGRKLVEARANPVSVLLMVFSPLLTVEPPLYVGFKPSLKVTGEDGEVTPQVRVHLYNPASIEGFLRDSAVIVPNPEAPEYTDVTGRICTEVYPNHRHDTPYPANPAGGGWFIEFENGSVVMEVDCNGLRFHRRMVDFPTGGLQ